jgi:hypothetical protein
LKAFGTYVQLILIEQNPINKRMSETTFALYIQESEDTCTRVKVVSNTQFERQNINNLNELPC